MEDARLTAAVLWPQIEPAADDVAEIAGAVVSYAAEEDPEDAGALEGKLGELRAAGRGGPVRAPGGRLPPGRPPPGAERKQQARAWRDREVNVDEVDVSFENWAHAAMLEWPSAYEDDPIRIYIRGTELRRLLVGAYRAGWEARAEPG